jgi:iron complex outermembrane receptor protein
MGTVAPVLYVTNQSAQFDRRMRVSTTGAVVLLLMMVAAGARADSPEAGGLDEILVTAQRRSENLQTVPIAIRALSGQSMAEGGVHDLGTLASYVPGLTFSPFSQDQNILSIRGVSSNDGGAGTDSSVTVFVDDVYLGRISDLNIVM